MSTVKMMSLIRTHSFSLIRVCHFRKLNTVSSTLDIDLKKLILEPACIQLAKIPFLYSDDTSISILNEFVHVCVIPSDTKLVLSKILEFKRRGYDVLIYGGAPAWAEHTQNAFFQHCTDGFFIDP